MDKLLVSMLQKTWGRNIIYSVFGVMAAAAATLGWFSAKMVEEVSAVREEVVECERRCAGKIDSIRQEQIAEVKAALERQGKIEQYIQQIRRKK